MARCRQARLIDVGKVPGRPCLPQEAINDLLIRLACQHRKVVRLKGGDPFIFGPGSADLLTLRAHRLLGEADVIVHDRLVGEEIPGMARCEARLIDVGKVPGRPCRRRRRSTTCSSASPASTGRSCD